MYLFSRAFIRARAGRPGGVILNVSSSVANGATLGMSAYGGSKTAVNR